ncbi:hypothetical protein IAU60_006757 [Kwoniella sp. DSM 27419]
MSTQQSTHLYSLVVALHSSESLPSCEDKTLESDLPLGEDWRLGDITVDWVDFTREKAVDRGSMRERGIANGQGGGSRDGTNATATPRKKATLNGRNVPGSAGASPSPVTTATSSKAGRRDSGSPDALSLQPLLAHFPGPNPLDSSFASGLSELGRGVVHLFRHAPPPSLIASIDSHPVGEGSKSSTKADEGNIWGGDKAEGEDGSLIAILAVPAWMRPADFLEFIGGWGTCLEGVRMIREATTPNRSIVLLKFRDPLQASDFLVIFTGRAFSTLDARETCHPIRIHHLILHKLDKPTGSDPIPIPAFTPSVYSSRARMLPELLNGVSADKLYELPSCPVCLERLDSTITGLVTLPCAHTFDCDCLRKWGDSRCPVCRVSHLLLSASSTLTPQHEPSGPGRGAITRLTKCAMCNSTENNWICVVCGVVGCGRYEPQKGHARRHWEESGHVLAMELETQRVWDYKGDNYVHRLIQTRNDGKLVELPSASSLVTPSMLPMGASAAQLQGQTEPPVNSRPSIGGGGGGGNADAGPSSNDVEKMSTIESITLEYSYLLSSQLESMRQHYESQQSALLDRLSALERGTRDTEARLNELEGADRAREKAEKKADKCVEVSRSLQASLQAEKAITEGLSTRIKSLESKNSLMEGRLKDKEDECKGLEETVRDLMFSLEAGMKVQELGGEGGEGGDLVVVPGKTKKKGRK